MVSLFLGKKLRYGRVDPDVLFRYGIALGQGYGALDGFLTDQDGAIGGDNLIGG